MRNFSDITKSYCKPFLDALSYIPIILDRDVDLVYLRMNRMIYYKGDNCLYINIKIL